LLDTTDLVAATGTRNLDCSSGCACHKASRKLASQKLSAAQSERPVGVSILDERNDDIGAFEIAGILEQVTPQFVESQLFFLGSISGSDLDQDNLVGSYNSRPVSKATILSGRYSDAS
jgi:hypothetical protein